MWGEEKETIFQILDRKLGALHETEMKKIFYMLYIILETGTRGKERLLATHRRSKLLLGQEAIGQCRGKVN